MSLDNRDIYFYEFSLNGKEVTTSGLVDRRGDSMELLADIRKDLARKNFNLDRGRIISITKI